MGRHFFDDEEDFKDEDLGDINDDDNDDDDDDDIGHAMDDIDIDIDIDIENIELYRAGLKQRLLKLALQMLEKSFWWRFYGTKTKVRMIREMYRGLVQILES